MNKPFHLMTPAERTAARIAENRAIAEKIAAQGKVETTTTKKGAKTRTQRVAAVPQQPPSVSATQDFTRLTPEERAAQRGSLIRKVGLD